MELQVVLKIATFLHPFLNEYFGSYKGTPKMFFVRLKKNKSMIIK